MSNVLLKTLNVEPGEAGRVYFLLAQGFFMGIFLATYSVASTSLFITRFDEEIDLPNAILLSGAVGILATSIYAFFQTKVSFKNLARGSLLLITFLVVGTFFGIEYSEDNSQVVYAAFVFTIPFASISLLIFWGIFGRIFDLRQSKRIIGGIDTGQLIASILALFGIGFVVNSGFIESEGLYLFSGISAFLLFCTVIALTITYDLQSLRKGMKPKQLSFVKIAKHKYIRLMASFVIVSLIAAFFVDYSFLNVTSIQFQTDQELTSFIALFEATVVIFSFLFQTFVTDWVIANYGLKIALIVNPILIGLFTVLALFIGLIVGYSSGTENFIFFFLIIAMSKLFIDSIKDALDGPSFKLYFLPIDPSVKFDVQTKIEGVVTAFAGVVAGALIIFINYLQLDLIYLTVFLLPVLGFWAYNVVLMHKQYRLSLQEKLAENESESHQKEVFHINQSLNSNTLLPDSDVISSLKIMEKIHPDAYEGSVSNLQQSNSKRVKVFANRVMDRISPDPGRNIVVRELAMEAFGGIERNELVSITPERLYTLSKSYKKSNRLLAAKLLRGNSSSETVFVLIELLRDIEPEVKLEAIHAARLAKRQESWSLLIEMLNSATYRHAAAAALAASGHQVLDYLETQFHRSGQSRESQLIIVEIIGRVGGKKSFNLLWKKIEYPDRKIVRQILEIFDRQEFSASESQVIRLSELLDDEIGKAIWNLAAIDEIKETSETKLLRQAIQFEIQSNFDFIYLLLGLIYDKNSVALVRSNIEANTSDGTAYALELLDIFLAKDLKSKLFPLFDDLSNQEKLKRLQEHFPRESYKQQQTLNYILHRDYNSINRWTKVCALELLARKKDFKVTKGLVAHLFNPDTLISSSAARILYKHSRGTYETISRRLQDSEKRTLDQLLHNQGAAGRSDNPYPFEFDRIRYMLTIPEFQLLPPVIVSQIASQLEVRFIAAGASWPIESEMDSSQPIAFVAKGSIQLRRGDEVLSELDQNAIFGELFFYENHGIDNVKAKEDTIIYTITNNDFFLTVANFSTLARKFVKVIAEKLDQKIIKTEV